MIHECGMWNVEPCHKLCDSQSMPWQGWCVFSCSFVVREGRRYLTSALRITQDISQFQQSNALSRHPIPSASPQTLSNYHVFEKVEMPQHAQHEKKITKN